MKTSTSKKDDFLDEVVGEMGDEDGNAKYGASMEDEGEMEEGDETMEEDQVMAAKQVGKALGLPNVDGTKLKNALKAFMDACA